MATGRQEGDRHCSRGNGLGGVFRMSSMRALKGTVPFSSTTATRGCPRKLGQSPSMRRPIMRSGASAGDALDVDNHRYLACPCGRPFACCASTGGRPEFLPRGAADYLAVALAPQGPRADHARIQAEVAAERRALGSQFGLVRLHLPCNVAQSLPASPRARRLPPKRRQCDVFFLAIRCWPTAITRTKCAGQGQGRGPAPAACSTWRWR